MSHRYRHPVRVWSHRDGSPSSFLWRGERHHIIAVYSTWHLMDRWWDMGNPYAAKGPADRRYWRVECKPWLQADLYYDKAQNTWILDRVLD